MNERLERARLRRLDTPALAARHRRLTERFDASNDVADMLETFGLARLVAEELLVRAEQAAAAMARQ